MAEEKLTEKQQKILSIIKDNPGVGLPEIAHVMEVVVFTLTKDIRKLFDAGKIKHKKARYFLV